MKGLSFLSGNEWFVVDVTLVQKVIHNMTYTPIPAAPVAVAGIANMKGGIITLLSLSELLGYERNPSAVSAVVFKSLTKGNNQMGLLIEKPEDLITINEDEMIMLEAPFILGLVESKEKLYRILDVDSIINRYKEASDTIAQGGDENEEKN